MRIINIAHAQVMENSPRLANVALNVLEFLLQVLGIIAIITLVISGILYLTAGANWVIVGDSDSQIDLAKKSLTYSIVGILVALGALIIVKQIGGFVQ